MKMNCIAIDDEQLALKKLIRYSEKLDYLKMKGTFTNPLDGLYFLKNNEVDIIFLDIQMDGFSGIEFLEVCKNLPYIIITSAYDSYAIKSYEFNVIDYLLKPIQFPRFVKAVEKVYSFYKKDLQANTKNIVDRVSNSILIKSGRETIKVNTDEILYIEGMKDYLSLVTKEKKILTLMNFKDILDELDSNKFCRIHKSYIVPFSKIEAVTNNSVKISGNCLPISNSYKHEFNNKFERYRILMD